MGKSTGKHAHAQGPKSQDDSTRNTGTAALEKTEGAQGSEADESAQEKEGDDPDDEGGSESSVARNATLMSAATLLSRITGLIRTWAMAYAMGNTLVTSAYNVASTLPNAIYDLVAGGLLGTAFVPVYLLQREKYGKEEANRFACNILNIIFVIMGVISILASIFAPQVIATQTFTVDDEALVTEYSIQFFRIFAVQILLFGVGGVLEGIANANRVYFLPSLAPVFRNIINIIAFFAYVPISNIDQELGITMLAIGTTLGVLVQTLMMIPALRNIDFKYTFRINLRDPALIEALKIAFPTFIYIVGTLFSYSFRNAFSLQTGDNGPSTLNYAWTWYQLPYGVIAVSLSRPLFTEMSRAVAKEDWDDLRSLVYRGITLTLLLIIPLAGLMGSLATPLMQLFQAGAFEAEDAEYVGSILALWVISLPFYSVLRYLHNVFASMRHFGSFAFVSCIMVVVQCGLYAFLCQDELLGLAGIPIADLVYYGACCIIMLIVLYKRIGSFNMKGILNSSLRVLAATAVGVVVTYGLSQLLPVTGSGMLTGFVTIIVCGIVGLVVIFGLCYLFRVPEMDSLIDLVKGLLARLGIGSKKSEVEASEAEKASEDRTAGESEDEGEGRGRHSRRSSDEAEDAEGKAEDEGPEGRHALKPSPKHSGAPEAEAPAEEPSEPTDTAEDEKTLPPDSTGAIMDRARHTKQ